MPPSIERESYTFPTRNYPYRYPPLRRDGRGEGDPASDEPAHPALDPGKLYSFVLGLDPMPRVMTSDEMDNVVRDPFASLLLKRGIFPLTLRNLLAELDATGNDPAGLPKQEQQCFLAADGGQIPWTPATANANRLFRFVIVRSQEGDAQLLISASTVLDSTTQFIQLIAWDESNAVYNFYERRDGSWVWAGNSGHALAHKTRGQGPFDSHVNGSLMMKELRLPWNNWHSMNASIQENVLAPNDPLLTEPLFVDKVSAHELERNVVRRGIERWNQARIKKSTSANGTRLSDVRQLFRQVLHTTTVNLVSASQQSDQVTDDTMLRLPKTFFLNPEALQDYIGLTLPNTNIEVPGRLYRGSLERYEFRLTDGSYTQKGDTFFAFLVPEPAFEDLNVLWLLLRRKIISRRFGASLLMVDFANPVFSSSRKKLMAYVPRTARLFDIAHDTNGEQVMSDLESQFVDVIEGVESTLTPNSPELQFLANWRLPEATWKPTFEKRIGDYFLHLVRNAATEEGFDGWVRLAESRRRQFRRRPLAEFRLTTPTTNIPERAPALVMNEDGSVRPANNT